MLNPTRKALQPTNVKNLDLRIFSKFGKKVGLWFGKMLSYINWFVSGGKKQEYSDTLRDDSNHTINFKDNSDELFIKSTDVDYLATDSDTLINKAPIRIVSGKYVNEQSLPSITLRKYSGKVTVNYILAGVPTTVTFDDEGVQGVDMDDNTEVAIWGNVEELVANDISDITLYHSAVEELEVLEYGNYHNLIKATLIGNDKLEKATFHLCKKMDTFTSLANKSLTDITLYNCIALQNIQLDNCNSLYILRLNGCTGLRNLTLNNLPSINALFLNDCIALESINIARLANLQAIDINQDGLPNIREIRFHATSQSITEDVIEIIKIALLTPGVLYVGKNDPYVSLIRESPLTWTVIYQ